MATTRRRESNKTNYWAAKLGFDAEDGHANARQEEATKAAAADLVVQVAASESSMEQWLVDFETRMAVKEQQKLLAARAQRERDAAIDDERELRRKQQELEALLCLGGGVVPLAAATGTGSPSLGGAGGDGDTSSLADIADGKRAAMERRAYEEAEKRALDLATAHLTPRAKADYVQDLKELAALEDAEAARAQRMASTQQIISTLVGAYEQRLQEEAAAVAAAEAAVVAAHAAFVAAQYDARVAFLAAAASETHQVLASEGPAWAEVVAAEVTGRAAAVLHTRQRGYAEASAADQQTADGLGHGSRAWEAFVDELLELTRLREKLRRHTK
jgi:hypothetical protein